MVRIAPCDQCTGRPYLRFSSSLSPGVLGLRLAASRKTLVNAGIATKAMTSKDSTESPTGETSHCKKRTAGLLLPGGPHTTQSKWCLPARHLVFHTAQPAFPGNLGRLGGSSHISREGL